MNSGGFAFRLDELTQVSQALFEKWSIQQEQNSCEMQMEGSVILPDIYSTGENLIRDEL